MFICPPKSYLKNSVVRAVPTGATMIILKKYGRVNSFFQFFNLYFSISLILLFSLEYSLILLSQFSKKLPSGVYLVYEMRYDTIVLQQEQKGRYREWILNVAAGQR
jgi:predicted membrane metal-binding protein